MEDAEATNGLQIALILGGVEKPDGTGKETG
jgi:hypothetical protein